MIVQDLGGQAETRGEHPLAEGGHELYMFVFAEQGSGGLGTRWVGS